MTWVAVRAPEPAELVDLFEYHLRRQLAEDGHRTDEFRKVS